MAAGVLACRATWDLPPALDLALSVSVGVPLFLAAAWVVDRTGLRTVAGTFLGLIRGR